MKEILWYLVTVVVSPGFVDSENVEVYKSMSECFEGREAVLVEKGLYTPYDRALEGVQVLCVARAE